MKPLAQAWLLFLALLCVAPSAQSLGGGTGGPGGLDLAAEREIARRQANVALAEDAMKRGDSALAAGDIANAYAAYKEAVDLASGGDAAPSLRARALSRFSSTSVRYAEYLVSQGEYAKAEAVAREVLEPKYNPDYRPAAVFLTRLEQPDYFNKTITPAFAEQRSEVEKLLLEANGYFDSGRYDLAAKKYNQVLAIDKYNAAALRGLEQVEVGKQRYYDSAYNETRSRMLWQVEKAWERPKRRFAEARTTDSSALQEERRGTEEMTARLNRIIIPSINIQDKSVRQAVEELKRQSRQLDTMESDPERRGVNIVLKLPPAGAAPAPAVGAEGENVASSAVAPVIPDTISLKLSDVPLYEALRYVATLAGLKIKVEPFAVSLVPLSEATDTLEQRDFKVPPGFITGQAATGDDVARPGRGETTVTNPRLAGRQTAKDFLEAQGVQFPPGSSANFIPGSSRLVVRNTPDNLNLIESLVSAAMGEQPKQVEIESKFVEISQNNLKELGFDWALGPFSIGGSGVYGGGGTTIDGSGGFPFINPVSGEAVGGISVTDGIRSGSGNSSQSAISVNSLDALIASSLGVGTTGVAPAMLSIAGIFTNPQFQVVIRALNQKKGVDLMAAPKVTTKSGQEATISISREFPYPEGFDPPEIPSNTGQGTQNNNGQINIQVQNDPIVTPSFPINFTTRNLGVTLKVQPNVGADGYTIELNLSPEVVDFDGFINYGSPIYSAPTGGALSLLGGAAANIVNLLNLDVSGRRLLTENIINQPIFSTRKVTTNVSIWDGQTVALGGLIREDVQKVDDKVPILGDIPLAGVLFRSEVDQKIKKNLIIFVTARLMDAAGQPLRPEDDNDQEEVVEPLGLPKDLQKPVISAKGFRQK